MKMTETLDLKAIRERWYGSKADDGVAITALVDEVERLREENGALTRAFRTVCEAIDRTVERSEAAISPSQVGSP